MAPLTARQPFKLLFIAYTILKEIPRLIFLKLKYSLPSLRPDPEYTSQQAFGVALLRTFFGLAAAIEIQSPESLDANAEKERWVVIKPSSDSSLYDRAPLNIDTKIAPQAIGANWLPHLYDSDKDKESLVILHFHGGAFVSIRPRDGDLASIRQVVVDGMGAVAMFPQYRLASNANGHFPAALQDAVSAYGYLLDQGIRPSRIAFSGDSAGGNLAIALLRYLQESRQSESLPLPLPAALLLWSPWVDMTESYDSFAAHRNQAVDYLIPGIYEWGRRAYSNGHALDDPYLSPAQHAFRTSVPIVVAVGRNDTLFDSVHQFVDDMRAKGADVETIDLGKTPHDIILAGVMTGFMDAAIAAGKRAKQILESKGI